MIETVNHPDYYNQGSVECIEAIKSSLTLEGFADFCKGNIEKYLWRYRNKNGVKDLEKAKVYLDWLIEAEKELEENMPN